MQTPQQTFDAITDELCAAHADVQPGPMMSSPGIRCKGKVFAFFHDGAMTFKLGKDFDAEAAGLTHWGYLAPFKNKPPMTAWVRVDAEHMERWPEFASLALDKIR